MSMSRRPVVRIVATVATLTVLLGLGLAVVLVLRNRKEADTRDRRDRPGFHEEAAEAGITFRMMFLPTEQGVNFRANL
jgi:hypothetical protein